MKNILTIIQKPFHQFSNWLRIKRSVKKTAETKNNRKSLPRIPGTFFVYLFLCIISLILYFVTIRGNPGIPTPHDIEYTLSQTGQAFETSQERARYALILSLVNDKSFTIDHYASMGTPDVGKVNGHYYSFFPPGASVLAIPLYLLGLHINAVQITTFLISTIFAFATMILILRFCLKLGLHWSVGVFSAVAFGFATNAWGYSVTLYAHLISAFFILLALYLTSFLEDRHVFLKATAVWVCYSIGVFLDFPNLFIFFPIALFLSLKSFVIQQQKDTVSFKLDFRYLITPLIFILLMGLYGYYNYIHFGSPFILSNSLPRVRDLKTVTLSVPQAGRDSVGALQTRSMLEGFTSFIVSNDRGVIKYSPVIVLFLFGIGYLKRGKRTIEFCLVAVAATCLVLYTMFGDPYGGWAFGSRYVIAIMPELCILAGIGLQRFSGIKGVLIKIMYSGVFLYSAAVALLAPLTTNVIPPYVEARTMGLQSDYEINIHMLSQNQLNSFVYNNLLHANISGFAYYSMIFAFVGLVGLFVIWYPKRNI